MLRFRVITHPLCDFCFVSDQLPVSTKYDMRSDPGVARNYGRLLLEMVSVVPDGIVCFFVSYSYMDAIVNTWNETGILKVLMEFDHLNIVFVSNTAFNDPIIVAVYWRW